MSLHPFLSLYFGLILRLRAPRRINLDLSSPNPPDRRPSSRYNKTSKTSWSRGDSICRDKFAEKLRANMRLTQICQLELISSSKNSFKLMMFCKNSSVVFTINLGIHSGGNPSCWQLSLGVTRRLKEQLGRSQELGLAHDCNTQISVTAVQCSSASGWKHCIATDDYTFTFTHILNLVFAVLFLCHSLGEGHFTWVGSRLLRFVIPDIPSILLRFS